jgi:hypothetical protein
MLGAFGTLIAATQAALLEWFPLVCVYLGVCVMEVNQEEAAQREREWGRDTGYMLGFALTMAVMYSLTAWFLTQVCVCVCVGVGVFILS